MAQTASAKLKCSCNLALCFGQMLPTSLTVSPPTSLSFTFTGDLPSAKASIVGPRERAVVGKGASMSTHRCD